MSRNLKYYLSAARVDLAASLDGLKPGQVCSHHCRHDLDTPSNSIANVTRLGLTRLIARYFSQKSTDTRESEVKRVGFHVLGAEPEICADIADIQL